MIMNPMDNLKAYIARFAMASMEYDSVRVYGVRHYDLSREYAELWATQPHAPTGIGPTICGEEDLKKTS